MEKELRKPVKENYKAQAKTIIKALEKRQMEGYYADTCAEAVEKALSLMEKGTSVGWGGSESLKEVGLMDALEKDGSYHLIDRSTAKDPEELRNLFGEMFLCDNFLMSTNAITMEGELVNIDGNGNRLSMLIYGPRQVIVLCGMNKVVKNREAALDRIHTTASPANCQRLSRKTPCALTGVCGDCYSPDSICSQIVVTRRSHIPGRIKVVLVGENLGY